jgi:hypothetical protein
VLNDKLRAPKSRVAGFLASNAADAEIILEVFSLALHREPTAEEKRRLTAAMAEYEKTPKGRREAIEDVFWAVLTSREFIFNH